MNAKVYAALGISDFKSYLFKYFLPIFMLDFFILFIFVFAFNNNLVRIIGVGVFFLILGALFWYPVFIIDTQSREIEETMHYFITYAGALSTVNLDRKELFLDLSEKTRYEQISLIFKKLIYLVESIKVDFATAAYKVSYLIKTEAFARFLERMGIALSFNTNASKFFIEEQKVLMNAYSVVYREGIERIKMVQEMFTSLVLAFAFVLATILLVPFISGSNATIFLQFGLLGLILLDVMMIAFAKFFIPADDLYHDLGSDEGRTRATMAVLVSVTLVILLAPFVFLFTDFPFMVKMAIAGTPMYIGGYIAKKEEDEVWKRDMLFPAFIRSLGDVHQAKGGTLTTTVETLLPHNFGILNEMIERVYKRLKITANKFNSWYYFTLESGSSLISEFMDIFISVVYRGGSAQLAGGIVSDNMGRLNGLRDQKREFASTLKGAVYGTFFGLAITLHMSLLISILLIKIFTSFTGDLDTGAAFDLISSFIPSGDAEAQAEVANVYIGIILTVHAIISGYLIKQVDGGNVLSMFTDFVILLWLGAGLEVVVSVLFKGMFAGYFAG